MNSVTICGITIQIVNNRAIGITENANRSKYDSKELVAALDGIEAFLLGVGANCAKIYLMEGITSGAQTALDAVANYYGDCDGEDT